MDDLSYTDRIIKDMHHFDKVIIDLEKMVQEGDNAKMKALANSTKVQLETILQIVDYVKNNGK